MKKYRTIPRIFTIYITEISYSAPQNVMCREWISSVPKNIYSHAEWFGTFTERFITVPYRGAGIFAAKTPNDTAEYYVRDPHGSTVRTVKADGTTVAEYEYDAFGNQLTNTDNANPFLYCGEYYDEETGLIYLRNRYYDPSTGRFITEDPAKDGMNWYVYCDNNPVNLWDPLGLDAIVLTSKDAAMKQGHTSAVYQDSTGSWYYTYWGDKAAAVIYIPDEYMDSLEHFNEGLNNILNHYGYTNITSDYTNATYIEGDFTASLQAAYDDVDGAHHNQFSDGQHYFDASNGDFVYQGQNSPYNLLGNNCFDRTYASLSKGTLSNGKNAGEYMRELGFKGGLIPNNAVSKFAEVFMNSSFTYGEAYGSLWNYANLYAQGSPWAQKWQKANYANAVTGW